LFNYKKVYQFKEAPHSSLKTWKIYDLDKKIFRIVACYESEVV
jgi:hypothetical protein